MLQIANRFGLFGFSIMINIMLLVLNIDFGHCINSISVSGFYVLKIRAGVEMALIDAVANSINVPLWRLFGGVTNSLTTAITVEFHELLTHYNVFASFLNKNFHIFFFPFSL